MAYLISMMFVCLAMAALLGFLLAYFLRGWVFNRRTDELATGWTLKMRQSEQERDTRIARLTSTIEDQRSQIPTLEKSLAERSELISGLEKEVENWKNKVPAVNSELEDQQREVQMALNERDELATELHKLKSEFNEKDSRLARIDAELNELRARQNKSSGSLVETEAALKQAQSTVEKFRQEIDTNKQNAADLDVARDQIKKLDAELSALKAQSSQAELNLNSNESRVHELNNALTAERKDRELTQRKFDEQQQFLNKTQQELKQANSMSTDFNDMQKKISGFEATLSESQNDVVKMREESKNWRHRYRQLEHDQNQRDQKLSELEKDINRWRDKYAQMESGLSEADNKKQQLESDLEQSRVQLQQLENDKQKISSQAANWQSELSRSRAKLDELESARAQHEKREEQLQSQLQDRHSRYRQVQNELAQWRKKATDSEVQAAQLKADTDTKMRELTEKLSGHPQHQLDLDQQLAKRNRQVEEKNREIAEWSARYDALLTANAQSQKSKPSVRAKQSLSAEELEACKPSWLLNEAPIEIDDLKKIHGVGPVLEKTMNKLGIYQFRQVAKLQGKEIEWVSSHINTFPGRIERDDWVKQAAQLHEKKYRR